MFSKVILALGALSFALAINAPVTTGNNPSAVYKAVITKRDTTPIRGSVVAHAPADGKGIEFSIKFANLPEDGGPYLYHIHEKPVPADGNCTGTGAHLDPYARGETPACDNTQPETCQVGDLSGKHGKPVSGLFSATYTDPYISSVEGAQAFFGNRSIVIHNKDKVRLTCANFALFVAKNQTSTVRSSGSASTTIAPSSVSSLASASTSVSATVTNPASVVPPSSTRAASSTVAVASNAASANGLNAAAILLGGVALLF